MPEPDLARAERAELGEVLPRRDPLAVGREDGRVDQAVALLGHGARVRAVAVDQPDVVAAATIGGEGDRLAVGRIARLHVPGDPGGQSRRLAALHRQLVEVAEEVEDDPLAVRRDVEGHPGPLLGVDRGVGPAPVSRRVVDRPLRLLLRRGLALCGLRRRLFVLGGGRGRLLDELRVRIAGRGDVGAVRVRNLGDEGRRSADGEKREDEGRDEPALGAAGILGHFGEPPSEGWRLAEGSLAVGSVHLFGGSRSVVQADAHGRGHTRSHVVPFDRDLRIGPRDGARHGTECARLGRLLGTPAARCLRSGERRRIPARQRPPAGRHRAAGAAVTVLRRCE